jgi:hypothetical protein
MSLGVSLLRTAENPRPFRSGGNDEFGRCVLDANLKFRWRKRGFLLLLCVLPA